jgi:ribosomal protein S4E
MIDSKDLRLIKANEFQVGGVFYLKMEDGFHTCRITDQEMRKNYTALKVLTMQYIKEGRIFVRINSPWGSFE